MTCSYHAACQRMRVNKSFRTLGLSRRIPSSRPTKDTCDFLEEGL